jgi:hypothetical protein
VPILKGGLIGSGIFFVFIVIYASVFLRSRLGIPSGAQYGVSLASIKSLTVYSIYFWVAFALCLAIGMFAVMRSSLR